MVTTIFIRTGHRCLAISADIMNDMMSVGLFSQPAAVRVIVARRNISSFQLNRSVARTVSDGCGDLHDILTGARRNFRTLWWIAFLRSCGKLFNGAIERIVPVHRDSMHSIDDVGNIITFLPLASSIRLNEWIVLWLIRWTVTLFDIKMMRPVGDECIDKVAIETNHSCCDWWFHYIGLLTVSEWIIFFH